MIQSTQENKASGGTNEQQQKFVQQVVRSLQAKLKEEALKYVIQEAAMKISKYIQLMKKKFSVIPSGGLIIQEVVDNTEIEILVLFRLPEWVEMRAVLATPKEISPDAAKDCMVYENLLRLSNDFPELSFCVDENYVIYAKQNILVGALTFDAFKEEYEAILASAIIFKNKLLPALKKCIRDYEEIKDTFESEIT